MLGFCLLELATSPVHSHSHCEHIHANALLCLEKSVPVKFATSLTIFLPLFRDNHEECDMDGPFRDKQSSLLFPRCWSVEYLCVHCHLFQEKVSLVGLIGALIYECSG